MTLLIALGVLTTIGGVVALWWLSNFDIVIGPSDEHPADHPLYDDMRLAQVRDEADQKESAQ